MKLTLTEKDIDQIVSLTIRHFDNQLVGHTKRGTNLAKAYITSIYDYLKLKGIEPNFELKEESND